MGSEESAPDGVEPPAALPEGELEPWPTFPNELGGGEAFGSETALDMSDDTGAGETDTGESDLEDTGSFGPIPEPESAVVGDGLASKRGLSSQLGVVVLLGLLAVGALLAVAIGRSFKAPSASSPAPQASPSTTTGGTSSTTAPAVKTPQKKPVGRVALKWGPLAVRRTGSLPKAPGAAPAAALLGSRLVVVGGTRGDRVYVGKSTGRSSTGPESTGRLVEVASLTTGHRAPVMFAAAGTVYVLGGEQGTSPTAQLLRITNPASPHLAAGSFVEPLGEAGAAVSGGAVYLAGGWTGSKYATAVLRFSPPTTATLVARLPIGVRSPAVAMLGGTLYVAGGSSQAGLSKELFAIDLSTGAVKALGELPEAVTQASLIVQGGKLFLLGGRSSSGPDLSIVRIDPATGKSASVGALPTPLVSAAVVPDGKQALVVDNAGGVIYRLG